MYALSQAGPELLRFVYVLVAVAVERIITFAARAKGDVMTTPAEEDKLLTPAEVAAMFRVDPKTVTRWAKAGKLSAIRTLGGHRRYRANEVRRLLEESTTLREE